MGPLLWLVRLFKTDNMAFRWILLTELIKNGAKRMRHEAIYEGTAMVGQLYTLAGSLNTKTMSACHI